VRTKWLTPLALGGMIALGAFTPVTASAQRCFHRHHVHRYGPVLYYGRPPVIYFVGSSDPLFAPDYTYPHAVHVWRRPMVVWRPVRRDYRWWHG
jgi:hypothetical protein